MLEKEFCRNINTRTIRMMLSDGTQISACVNIDRQPGYDRLSDLVSSDREPFLILMNAVMKREGANLTENHDTLFINKDHILWATPEEKQDI